jgi:hypothetical protein
MTFYDYDNDLWGSVNYNYSLQLLLFFDQTNPNHQFSTAAGEKIMGQRFSKLYFPNVRNEKCPMMSELSVLHNCTNFSISLIQVKDKDILYENNTINAGINIGQQIQFENLSFTHIFEGIRYLWTNVTESFLFTFNLGASDVFQISKLAFDTMKLYGSIPNVLSRNALNETLGIVLPNGLLSIISNNIQYHAHYSKFVFHVFKIRPSNILVYVEPHWLNLFGAIDFLPDIYHANKLLRSQRDKVVYVLLEDGKRHEIHNYSTFLKYGYSFDSIFVSQDDRTSEFLMQIPLGEVIH